MKCRHCRHELELTLVDLGSAPPSNAYLTFEKLQAPERWFPLKVLVCSSCWLVQIEDYAAAGELFNSDYAYFSSTSSSWLAHARDYATAIRDRLGLSSASRVVEVASNDGYLLQYFHQDGIPSLGIEPTASTAAASRQKGIETRELFFGRAVGVELAREGRGADLTAANNVLAHVPDINDFVAGFAAVLKADGVSTFEFPHLLQLMAHNQFDTIYHEHFSYLSLTAVVCIFDANGLSVFDVEELSTHGGSLRVFAQRKDSGRRAVTPAVLTMLKRERDAGMTSAAYYAGFQQRAEKVKDNFVTFLLQAKRDGKKVVGYGAAAKGNTLINFAGIRSDLISWVVDRAPSKRGKFLPGSRIPIVGEDRLRGERPDYICILPWNLRTEVMEQLAYAREWGTKFVTAVPVLDIV